MFLVPDDVVDVVEATVATPVEGISTGLLVVTGTDIGCKVPTEPEPCGCPELRLAEMETLEEEVPVFETGFLRKSGKVETDAAERTLPERDPSSPDESELSLKILVKSTGLNTTQ